MLLSSEIFKEVRMLQKALWEKYQFVLVFQVDMSNDQAWRITLNQKRSDHFHATNMIITDSDLYNGGSRFIQRCIQKLIDEKIAPMNKQFDEKKGKKDQL